MKDRGRPSEVIGKIGMSGYLLQASSSTAAPKNEWDARVDLEKREREAREKLAKLPAETVISLVEREEKDD